METDREGDCEGQSKLTVQFGWQITLPVIRSPTHPPLPEQSLRCVWSICWTYLHQCNTWTLTSFHVTAVKTITLPVIRSPTNPPLPEQSLKCVCMSICRTYLHQRNTWTLTFFHWGQCVCNRPGRCTCSLGLHQHSLGRSRHHTGIRWYLHVTTLSS